MAKVWRDSRTGALKFFHSSDSLFGISPESVLWKIKHERFNGTLAFASIFWLTGKIGAASMKKSPTSLDKFLADLAAHVQPGCYPEEAEPCWFVKADNCKGHGSAARGSALKRPKQHKQRRRRSMQLSSNTAPFSRTCEDTRNDQSPLRRDNDTRLLRPEVDRWTSSPERSLTMPANKKSSALTKPKRKSTDETLCVASSNAPKVDPLPRPLIPIIRHNETEESSWPPNELSASFLQQTPIHVEDFLSQSCPSNEGGSNCSLTSCSSSTDCEEENDKEQHAVSANFVRNDSSLKHTAPCSSNARKDSKSRRRSSSSSSLGCRWK